MGRGGMRLLPTSMGGARGGEGERRELCCGKRGESYAGGGGTGPLVARPSTLFEAERGENRAALSLSHSK